jgi:lysophospholipase L1-like esterase
MTTNSIDRRTFFLAGTTILAHAGWTCHATEPMVDRRFDLGPGKVEPGYIQVPPETNYTKERGYGFEPGVKIVGIDRGGDARHSRFCTADRPFYFSVAVPEGNYTVTVTLGDVSGEPATTVKAELRRLMVEHVETGKGKLETRSFTVNVRTAQITGGGEVKLKDREKKDEWWAWDDKLTLEFNGRRPCVCAVEIVRVDVPTIYLLGDSTVCDQPHEPFASWGQMLPRFFGSGVAVANHAESGESARSSLAAGRLEKVLSCLKKGDFLLIQFGHNDMKSVSAAAYKADLRKFVTEARRKEATAVLVTPMNRRTFQGDSVTNSLKDFPDAVRALAKEDDVPLIDLHAMSKRLYEALGPNRSGVLFKTGDGTHHNNYGAYELAKCVLEGVRQNQLDLVKHFAADVKPFDPAKPDLPDEFMVPASPATSSTRPAGK